MPCDYCYHARTTRARMWIVNDVSISLKMKYFHVRRCRFTWRRRFESDCRRHWSHHTKCKFSLFVSLFWRTAQCCRFFESSFSPEKNEIRFRNENKNARRLEVFCDMLNVAKLQRDQHVVNTRRHHSWFHLRRVCVFVAAKRIINKLSLGDESYVIYLRLFLNWVVCCECRSCDPHDACPVHSHEKWRKCG